MATTSATALPESVRRGRRAVAGHVHSVETVGTVDGPGVRYVVFTAGCPLRCVYCHSPDTRAARSEQLVTSIEVLEDVARYTPFLLRAHGGLTVSGGEPLAQPRFTRALLEGARDLGLHTALDTSGYLGDRAPDALLDACDLVLLDVKSWDPDTYLAVTGVPIEPTIAFARRLAERGVTTWVRFVLVPGLTDAPDNVAGVADFAASLPNVARVDVLPFHKRGEYKWRALGLPYTLAATEPPAADEVEAARSIFRARGLVVM